MAQLIRFAAACAAVLLCQYAAAQEPAPAQTSAVEHQEAGFAPPAAARPVMKIYPIVPFDLPADPHGVAGCEKLEASDTGSFALQCRRLWTGLPAGNPLPRLIDVERARERLASLPPPEPSPAPEE